jgi:hypothetical protein
MRIKAEQGPGRARAGTGPARPAVNGTPEALRHHQGQARKIGRDDERGYRARRRDGAGGGIAADGPDGLWAAIVAGYALRPVPRDVAVPGA